MDIKGPGLRSDVTNDVSSSHHLSAPAQPEEDPPGVDSSWYVALRECYHSVFGHIDLTVLSSIQVLSLGMFLLTILHTNTAFAFPSPTILSLFPR